MTEDHDFKRRVRARMEKTGESYAAARAQMLRTGPPSGPDPGTAEGAVQPQGLTFSEWLELRVNDVTEEQLRQFRAVDPTLEVSDVADLVAVGVDVEYYETLRAAAPGLTVEDVGELFTGGATPDHVAAARRHQPRLTATQIGELARHGIDPTEVPLDLDLELDVPSHEPSEKSACSS